MPEFPNAETRTLRRIALLVLRARQDEADRRINDRLGKIAAVIDHIKRDLAIGSRASDDDVASLALLVGGLPKASPHPISASVARDSTLLELRELVDELRPLPSNNRMAS